MEMNRFVRYLKVSNKHNVPLIRELTIYKNKTKCMLFLQYIGRNTRR